MITCVPNILGSKELAQLNHALLSASFADGRSTAGWHAREVKNNLQLAQGAAGYDAVEKIVRAALMQSAIFQMAIRPRFLRSILFNQYEMGMAYGPHVDDAIMTSSVQAAERIRSDVSFTLFLSEPADYDGGELAIDFGGIEQLFKLAAGSLVAYPANTLHRVAPVTRGTRLAAVGWVQSEVRDPAHRAILFDLDIARRSVFTRDGKSPVFDLLSKSHANLLRLWAEL